MKNKIAILFISISLLSATCILAGCGKSEENENTQSSTISVSEDIAKQEMETEETIPEEAKIYATVTFDVPEGMVADVINDEYTGYYFSGEVNNLSYISYTRNNKPANYQLLTQEQYEESFLKKYDVDVKFLEYDTEDKGDYTRTKMTMQYRFGGVSFFATEYVFVTEQYVFTVCFCEDMSSDMAKAFSKSENTITLNSVVGAIVDSETPGVEVSENAIESEDIIVNEILTDEEVLSKVNAGANLGE